MNSSKNNGIIFRNIHDKGMDINGLLWFFKQKMGQILAKKDNVLSMATD